MIKKLAKIKFLPNNFQIIEQGDYVECAVSGKKIDTLFNEFKDKNFSFFKEKLSEEIIKKISPIYREIDKLKKDISYIDQVLKDGSEKANELSSKKMQDIRKKFGF